MLKNPEFLSTTETSDAEDIYHSAQVVRMNSTFLEVVGGEFHRRGAIILFLPFLVFLVVGAMLLLYILLLTDQQAATIWSQNPLIALTMLVVLPILSYWAYVEVRQEYKQTMFRWTHLPIRFNRKKRKVHFYERDGSVRSVDWDRAGFKLSISQGGPKTAKRTRLVCEVTTGGKTSIYCVTHDYLDTANCVVLSYWEFLRRYMEHDDIRSLYRRLDYCVDVVDKKPDLACMWAYTNHFFERWWWIFRWMPLAALLFTWPGRFYVFRQSRLPVWPEYIEKQCAIDPHDPYLIDSSHNK